LDFSFLYICSSGRLSNFSINISYLKLPVKKLLKTKSDNLEKYRQLIPFNLFHCQLSILSASHFTAFFYPGFDTSFPFIPFHLQTLTYNLVPILRCILINMYIK
uniref:Uncharacterized protein n=1 Tax=Ciona savignyi TaxID=51511 RepID=H2YXV3_CIOSA